MIQETLKENYLKEQIQQIILAFPLDLKKIYILKMKIK